MCATLQGQPESFLLSVTTVEPAKDLLTPASSGRPAVTPATTAGRIPAWGRKALWITAAGVLTDVTLHGLQDAGWLGLGALAGGWCWLALGQLTRVSPQRLNTIEGWIERCRSLLDQFARLDPDPSAPANRSAALANLLAQQDRQALRLALVSSASTTTGHLAAMEEALRGGRPLQVVVSHPLPSNSLRWQWSEAFASCDAFIFHLQPPLMAAELRWLEALPPRLPLWVLMEAEGASEGQVADLCSQWPAANRDRLLLWDGHPRQLGASLAPLGFWLAREGDALPATTLCRCLEQLHGRWQADLERLRRQQWLALQQRTQWLVAAGVLITPAMSLDLLVLSVANGLMLREMAQLWDCRWSLEQLRAAAGHVGKAALVLGVVEWSSQAITTAFRLHGATWLVGGTLQALSAAYLTRVISHAMADLMARYVGVCEPDLQAIKAEAPLLVAKAAEAERLDWGAFLQEARNWLVQQEGEKGIQAGGA